MSKIYLSSLIITLISFAIPFFIIIKNKDKLFEKFDIRKYENKYYQSQWVLPNSKNLISDIDLYAYAGYRYIKGENPILINPEVPPLGKYIVGLSILFFNNFRVLNLVACFLSLVLIFLLSYQLTQSFFQSSLSLFLTSINSLFLDQIINAGQLEIFQLLFLLAFYFFFIKFLRKKRYIFLLISSFVLGCFISIKFFFYFYLLINLTIIIFFFIYQKSKKLKINWLIKIFIILNFISLLVYSLTYFQLFLKSRTLIKFLGAQKWIFNFYNQSKVEKNKIFGNYLALLFLNKWRYWTGNYPWITYENWSLIWPITFILGIFSFLKLSKQKQFFKNNLILLIFSFFIAYNLFLFITPIYPRYLLLLLVPLNIVIPLIIKI